MSNYNKLTGLAWWGAWAGLVGGCIGILTGGADFIDRVFQSRIEIFGLRPIAVYSKEKLLGGDEHPAYGVSAIIHIKNGHKAVTVGGLDYYGKAYMGVNSYMPYMSKVEGRSIGELADEVNQKKPYYLLSLNGWPVNPSVPIKLEPFEERCISFTFLEPTLKNAGEVVDAEIVGTEAPFKVPSKKRTKTNWFDVFKARVSRDARYVLPFDLREEPKMGNAVFSLRVGSGNKQIKSSKIREFRSISKEDWDALAPSRLYNQPDVDPS